jgi:mono/diheme cytochrome c family protein
MSQANQATPAPMKIFFTIAVFLISVSCNKKSAPVIADRKAEPPKRIVNIYAPPGTVTPDTEIGKTLFTGSCIRCHGLPDLSLYRAARWEGILQTMIPRTRLDQEQAVHVRAYVLANAAK